MTAGGGGAGRGTRVAAVLATALAATPVSPGAVRAGLSVVDVDHVRVDGRGRHRVWVSVLDEHGLPVTGLQGPAFAVEEDGHAVEGLEVRSTADLFDRFELTLLADPELLEGPVGGALARALEGLGQGAGSDGRLRVVAASPRPRAAEEASARASRLAEQLPRLAERGGEPRLYDALFDEVRRATRLPDRVGRAVLMVTRGADAGSGRGVVDVLALARGREHPVPIFVVLLEDRGAAPEGERLLRLAPRTGGTVTRIGSSDGSVTPAALAEAIPPPLLRGLARVRGGHRLRFTAPKWSPDAERHALRVTVSQGGVRRWWTGEFETRDALIPPWWVGPAPWVWLGALLVAASGALVAARRRPVFTLVVLAGEEEGCRYEVYRTPLTLGASSGNDLVFEEPRLSRNHAVLDRRGRGIEIADLNSENGTFVNGERVTRRLLADGDQISLGRTMELMFEGRG